MGQQKLWYLVAYDIRDPKRLRQAAKCLKGYGARVQYSVFRCLLGERETERLHWELTKILHSDDNLLLVGLCETCVKRVLKKNPNAQWPEEPLSFEIV